MSIRAYGVPYKGSKNAIAEWIIGQLPPAKHFYDLFAGGCALSHCALFSDKWQNIHINDITDTPSMFIKALNGEYKDRTQWVTRKEFFAKKEEDPFIKSVWSFGNNGEHYLYGEDREDYKRCLHKAIVDCEYEELKEKYGLDASVLDDIKDIHKKRIAYKHKVLAKSPLIIKKGDKIVQGIQHLEHLARLSRINDIYRLVHLERLDRINGLFPEQELFLKDIACTRKSYDEIEIEDDSIIVCDIPYRNTSKYNKVCFDYEKFYDWCLRQKSSVYICEYTMPENRFERIAVHTKRQLLNQFGADKLVEEGLFIPRQKARYIGK